MGNGTRTVIHRILNSDFILEFPVKDRIAQRQKCCDNNSLNVKSVNKKKEICFL